MTSVFTVQIRAALTEDTLNMRILRDEVLANSLSMITAERLASLDEQQLNEISNGTGRVCNWSAETHLRTVIQDQAGLIDLNTASNQLVSTLLSGFGLSQLNADRVVQAMNDFKDEDKTDQQGADENHAYASPDYVAKNSAFDVTGELDQVNEIPEPILRKTLQYFTTFSQQQGIDLSAAPSSLISMLKQSGAVTDLGQLATPSPRKTYGVDISLTDQNFSYSRHAIASLTRQPERPFSILDWRRVFEPDLSASTQEPLIGCT